MRKSNVSSSWSAGLLCAQTVEIKSASASLLENTCHIMSFCEGGSNEVKKIHNPDLKLFPCFILI